MVSFRIPRCSLSGREKSENAQGGAITDFSPKKQARNDTNKESAQD